MRGAIVAKWPYEQEKQEDEDKKAWEEKERRGGKETKR
jgi:hypothetical protein